LSYPEGDENQSRESLTLHIEINWPSKGQWLLCLLQV